MYTEELEITKEMYLEAKKVEKMWEMSEKNEYFNDIWTKKDRDFRKKYGKYLDTWEIVNEYERREANTDRLLTEYQNVYRFTYLGDTTREFKFFSCYLDKENGKLYTLANNIHGNPVPSVLNTKHIKNVQCIKRNNNLDYQ